MAEYIKINGQEYSAEVIYLYKDKNWNDRDVRNVFLNLPYDQVVALMPTGTKWSSIIKENDVVTEETDMSEFSIAGQVVDYRNGTVSIKMGKPTEAENAVGAVVALTGEVVTVERAAKLRPMIEAAATSLPDGEAAAAVELFPKWEYPVSYIVGNRVSDGGKLYKCRKAHTSQALWEPAATPALWVVVDVSHAGTQDDPIHASRGMEYEYGKYYLDSEDGKTYKCERIGEAAGGKIVLQYLPHELVGQYFKAVNA